MAAIPQIRVDADGAICTLSLNRPSKRNAMALSMWEELPAVLEEISTDASVAVLVVRGEGAHFSAGADISEFDQTRGTPTAAERYREIVDRAETALAEMPIPTVAAVRGFAIGGGLEIAIACDIRIMSDTARCGITASKMGIVYSVPSTRRLASIVGPAWAKWLLFSSQLIDARRAEQIGLAHEVVADDQLDRTVADLATTLRERSPITLEAAKRTIDQFTQISTLADPDVASLTRDAAASDFYQQRVAEFIARSRAAGESR